MKTLFLIIMLGISTIAFAEPQMPQDKPVWKVNCTTAEKFSIGVVLSLMELSGTPQRRKELAIQTVKEAVAESHAATDDAKKRILLDQLAIVDKAYYIFENAVIPYQPTDDEIVAFAENMRLLCENNGLPSQSMDVHF